LLNILLAEDNAGDVNLVREALQEHNIQHCLHLVTDGAQAMRFLAEMGRPGSAPCPDLLLLDLNLPKVDGAGILQEFRKRAECALTPVIVVTSSDSAKDRARMEALGVDRYFRKPLDYEAFLKLGMIVREVTERAA
jgi:chemotaxis family two-component system response regulator Rcp1